MILYPRLIVMGMTWLIAWQEILVSFGCFDVYVQNVAIAWTRTIYWFIYREKYANTSVRLTLFYSISMEKGHPNMQNNNLLFIGAL